MKKALFILLPISVLLWFPIAFEEFESPKAFALVTFSCFVFFFVRWRYLLKDRVAQALALFSISAAASTIYSIDWHMSVFGNSKCPMGLLVIISYLVVYLAAAQVFRREKSARQAIDIMLACSAVVSGYAIAQVLGYDFRTWYGVLTTDGYTRPMSTLGHPNFMAAYLGMVLPFTLWRIDNSNQVYKKILLGFLAFLSTTAIFLSLSRGMCIATVAGIVVYMTLNRKHIKTAAYLLAIAVVTAITCLITSPVLRQTAVERYRNMITPGYARLEYPKGAIRIWKRYPWLGSGTDTFELTFQHQRTPFYWQIERAGSPHRAHNDFLNILATQGIFGALTFLFFTMAAAYRAARSKSPFAAPATAAIVSFYVAGVTSFMVIATGTMLMVCLALLKGKNEDRIEDHRKHRSIRVFSL